MGCCQNHGPFLGALEIRCRIIIGIQKRTISLTTTHISKFRSIPFPCHTLQDWLCCANCLPRRQLLHHSLGFPKIMTCLGPPQLLDYHALGSAWGYLRKLPAWRFKSCGVSSGSLWRYLWIAMDLYEGADFEKLPYQEPCNGVCQDCR